MRRDAALGSSTGDSFLRPISARAATASRSQGSAHRLNTPSPAVLARIGPADRQPRARSIQIAWPPPCGLSISSRSWPSARERGHAHRRECRAPPAPCPAYGKRRGRSIACWMSSPYSSRLVRNQRLPHRLEMPAHHAVRHHRLAVLRHHAGDDRVHRPLVGRDAVRVPALDAEAVAAVLQHHAGIRGQDAGAEALEQRVDEAAGIAVAIDDAEIGRVLVHRQRAPRPRRASRASRGRRRSARAARRGIRR